MKGSAGFFFGLRLDRLNGHNIRLLRLSGRGAAEDRSRNSSSVKSAFMKVLVGDLVLASFYNFVCAVMLSLPYVIRCLGHYIQFITCNDDGCSI